MSGNELEQLGDALDALASMELGALGRSSMQRLVLGLESARTRLESVSATVLAAFDANGDWAGETAQSAAAWVKSRTGTTRVDAVSRLRLANRLRLMPVAAAAFAAGEITEAHVRLLSRCLGPRTREALAEAEAGLVDHARSLDADRFAKVIEHWLSFADPDGAEPRRERPDELFASETIGGRVVGKFNLSRETGLGLLESLRSKTDELFHRDRRLREVDPTDPLLDMSTAERRARALIELIDKGFSVSDPLRRQPGLTVIVDERTLAGVDAGLDARHETMYGSIVPMGLLNTLLCDCGVSRLVMSAEGVPLDLGREVRTATRQQRAALRARDGGCAVPGCDCTPNWCDAHHIVWWHRGGKTDLENLVYTCRHHHRRIHNGLLEVRMVDGLPRFWLPDGTELREPERATAVAAA
jgi:hypothetical protein